VIDGLARARCRRCSSAGRQMPPGKPKRSPQTRQLDVLELPGVDHAVQVPGDPLASLGALRQIAESIGRLAAGV